MVTVLTKGGLKSQAPTATLPAVLRRGAGRAAPGGGGRSSREAAQLEAARQASAKAAAEARAAQVRAEAQKRARVEAQIQAKTQLRQQRIVQSRQQQRRQIQQIRSTQTLQPQPSATRVARGRAIFKERISDPLRKRVSRFEDKRIISKKTLERIPEFPPAAKAVFPVVGLVKGKELLPETTKELAVDVLTLGVGAGVGVGVKGARIISKKVGGKVAARRFRTLEKGAAITLGGIFAGQKAKELIQAQDFDQQSRVVGRAVKEIGLFAGGAKAGSRAASFLAEPKIKTIPIRKPIEPTFTEVQAQVIRRGKATRVGAFKIFGEKAPPIRREVTTEFREFIGAKPKKVTIIPARRFSVETPFGVIGKKPFFATEAVQRGRSRAVVISGKGRQVGRESFSQLAKSEQLPLRRLAESKTGLPATTKTARAAFAKETKLDISEIKTVDFLTRAGRILPRGRRVRRAVAVTEVRPFIKTPEVDIFTAKTFFKDVTFPGARARGKTPRLTGIIKRIREPIFLDKASEPAFPKPSKKDLLSLRGALDIPTPITKPFIRPSPITGRVTRPVTVREPLKPVSVRPRRQAQVPSLSEVAKGSSKALTSKAEVLTKSFTSVSFGRRTKQVPRAKQIPLTKQIPRLAQEPLTKQRQKPKQAQRLRSLLSPFPRTGTKGIAPFFIRQKRQRVPKKVLLPSFEDDLLGKKRTRAERKLREEAVFFSPTFVQKAFDIKRRITKKEARRIALSGDPFTGRPIPIFID